MNSLSKNLLLLLFLILLFPFACSDVQTRQTENSIGMYEKMTVKPPKAKKDPKELTQHGHTRIDDYYWLNQREDSEVIAYLDAENEYKDAIMADLKETQEELFQEMKGRIKEDDSSVPYLENGYWYS